MSIEEIRNEFFKHGYFYGRMYGSTRLDDEVIKIKITLNNEHAMGTHWNERIEPDGFIYIWGMPGYDGNEYNWRDYGKTWAYELEDFTMPYKYDGEEDK